jgi:histone deacetylase complex regulatory component SIN3
MPLSRSALRPIQRGEADGDAEVMTILSKGRAILAKWEIKERQTYNDFLQLLHFYKDFLVDKMAE